MSEILLNKIPPEEKIESLLKGNPNIKINLANTEEPFFLGEFEYLEYYSENINGLNIELDTCDQYEIQELWRFIDLKYLKLTFPKYIISEGEYEYLPSWLMNAKNLKGLFFLSLPNDNDLFIDVLFTSFSLDKNFPVYLFIKEEKKRKKVKSATSSFPDIPPVSLLNVFSCPDAEMSDRGIKNAIQQYEKIQSVDPKEVQYYGNLAVESNFLQLSVSSLNVDIYKEVVIRFEGKKGADKFFCGCRCKWNDAEHGFYFASHNTLEFQQRKTKRSFFSLKINNLTITENGDCEIYAEWLENSNNYKVEGTLEKQKTKDFIDELNKLKIERV